MQFPQNFPTIDGERIRMADLSTVSVEEFLPIAMKGGKMITDRAKVADLIVNLGQGFLDQKTLCWGVFLDSKLIGMCGFFRGFENRVGEIGYMLHADFRGKGYMSEAITMALNFGWNTLELERVIAITASDNTPSIKLLESMGFKRTSREMEPHVEYDIHCLKD